MRLIDADSLVVKFTNAPWTEYSSEAIIRDINNQPTAYDVDEVVERLQNIPHGNTLNVELEEVIISIVKGAVKDE